jgi:alkylated DNA repair dioxygenase AlkB
MERRDLGQGAWLAVVEGFAPDHAALMERLAATLPLQVETIRLFGREVETPRLTSWHGDPGARYAYSGRLFEPRPWTAELQALRARLDGAVGVAFNSVLVNHYRDGRDSMGEHADDEPELGPAPDDVRIASLSLGARRRFLLRHKRSKTVVELSLGEGNLLVMGGTTQRHFRHRVPPTAAPVGARMNLTFRVIVSGAGEPDRA